MGLGPAILTNINSIQTYWFLLFIWLDSRNHLCTLSCGVIILLPMLDTVIQSSIFCTHFSNFLFCFLFLFWIIYPLTEFVPAFLPVFLGITQALLYQQPCLYEREYRWRVVLFLFLKDFILPYSSFLKDFMLNFYLSIPVNIYWKMMEQAVLNLSKLVCFSKGHYFLYISIFDINKNIKFIQTGMLRKSKAITLYRKVALMRFMTLKTL